MILDDWAGCPSLPSGNRTLDGHPLQPRRPPLRLGVSCRSRCQRCVRRARLPAALRRRACLRHHLRDDLDVAAGDQRARRHRGLRLRLVQPQRPRHGLVRGLARGAGAFHAVGHRVEPRLRNQRRRAPGAARRGRERPRSGRGIRVRSLSHAKRLQLHHPLRLLLERRGDGPAWLHAGMPVDESQRHQQRWADLGEPEQPEQPGRPGILQRVYVHFPIDRRESMGTFEE